MRKVLLLLSLCFWTFYTNAQCTNNVDFNTWSKAGQPANGNWVVQNGGTQVHQTVNGDPSFFISPFDLMNVRLRGRFKTNDLGFDDDYMGFVFSFLDPMGASDNFDCWLYDWKQAQQGGAPSGMSLDRALGVIPPANYNAQFWNHQNSPEFTVVQNTFGGPGWVWNNNHDFELQLTYTRATIYVDGNLIFDQFDCFKPGRFGFYNLSQKDCYYSNFSYDMFINFTLTSQKVCLGNSVGFQFVSPCVNANLSQYKKMTWDFGDGNTTVNNAPTFANANVTHTYTSPGLYKAILKVEDFNNCFAYDTQTVDVRAKIVANGTVTDPKCNGALTGSIALAPTGGFGNFSYAWSGGSVGSSLVGVTAGNYAVTITDGLCTSTAQYTINQPSAITANTSHTDATCGNNDGTASIVLSGGTPPYNGNWGLAHPGTNITGLGAGTYIADFKDANGCSSLLQYKETVISLPCGVSVSTTKTDVKCFGGNSGTATLNVTGGTNPINITWTKGGLPAGSGATINGLSAGSYDYSYSDGAGKTFNGTVIINQPTLGVSGQLSTTGISCSGSTDGQAIASVTAGGVSPYNYAWSGGQPNSSTANNLSAGPITVTITDANLCTAVATASVSSVPSLVVVLTNVMDSCYLSGKGSASSTVSGGTQPYTYKWSDLTSNPNLTGLKAGSYSLTVTDFKGCSASATTNVAGAPKFSFTKTAQNIKCFGGNGSINITASGGTPGYSYNWSPATASGNNPTTLAPGIYNYSVTDAYGCQLLGGDTITQPAAALSATTSHTNVTCHGAANGTITIIVSGGTKPYTYLGNLLPKDTVTVLNLGPGTYAGNVIDSNGCIFPVSEMVTEPALQSLTVSSTNNICFGGSTATASANFVNATGAVTYNWNPGGVLPGSRNGLVSGTYNVTATDQNGCSFAGSTIISEPTKVVATYSSSDVNCFGGATGSILVTPSGGTPNYTYTWNPATASGNNPSSLVAGLYLVTVADNNGCKTDTSINVTQPTAPLTIASQSKVDVKCFGGNDGSANLKASGGTYPYTYTWSLNVSIDSFANNLAANTYGVTVYDKYQCSVATTFNITQPAVGVSILSKNQLNVKCFGGNDGAAVVTPVGGSAPYSYSWSPNSSTDSFAVFLTAGNYSVIVKDVNQCSVTDNFTILEPTKLTAQYATTSINCFGDATGSILVTPTGGTPTYTYTWNPATASGNNPTALTGGTYQLTITDQNSCKIDTSIIVVQPLAALTIASQNQQNIKCFGGTDGAASVVIAGGTYPYSYNWSPNSSVDSFATGLAVNTYGVTVYDARQCSVSTSFNITEPAVALSILSKNQLDVKCFGTNTGAAVVTPVGGTTPYSYSWSPNASIDSFAISLIAGNYFVTVKDANQCSVTDNFTIQEPTQLVAQYATTGNNCFGQANGTITVTPSGGTPTYTYTWNPATASGNNPTSLTSGTYLLTVTDGNNCIIDTSIVVPGATAPLVFTQIDSNDIKCFGGTDGRIKTYVSGGTSPYSYTWSPNVSSNDSAVNLSVGPYSVTVADNNGCTVETAVDISEPATAISLTSQSQTEVSCFGGNNGTASVIATGGTPNYNYTWNPNVGSGSSVSTLTMGTYTVTVSDNNGCTVATSFTISEPLQIVASNVAADVKCNGGNSGSITVNAQGGTPSVSGYQYTWTPNVSSTNSDTNLTAGTYTIVVSDSLSCTATTTATLSEPSAIQPSATVSDESCFAKADGYITAAASGGAGGFGYEISAAGGAFTSNGSDNFTGLSAGNYQIRVTDANGCTVVSNYTVSSPTEITTSATSDSVNCFGYSDGAIHLTGTTGGNPGGYTYSLAGGSNSSGNFSDLSAANYTVTVTDTKGCTTTVAVLVEQPEELTLDISTNPASAYLDSVIVNMGDPVQLNASSNYTSVAYSWTPPNGLSCTNCPDPTVTVYNSIRYTLTATARPVKKDCIVKKDIAVTVLKNYQLYLPNAFTPNGDGANDEYEIFGNKAAIKFLEINIFNRWGEKVFESNDINFKWDGKYKGTFLNPGVYVYQLKVVFVDDHSEPDFAGSITLIR